MAARRSSNIESAQDSEACAVMGRFDPMASMAYLHSSGSVRLIGTAMCAGRLRLDARNNEGAFGPRYP